MNKFFQYILFMVVLGISEVLSIKITKDSIDLDMLSNLINQKQQELQNNLEKRLILKELKGDADPIKYLLIENTIQHLLCDKDPKLMVNKIKNEMNIYLQFKKILKENILKIDANGFEKNDSLFRDSFSGDTNSICDTMFKNFYKSIIKFDSLSYRSYKIKFDSVINRCNSSTNNNMVYNEIYSPIFFIDQELLKKYNKEKTKINKDNNKSIDIIWDSIRSDFDYYPEIQWLFDQISENITLVDSNKIELSAVNMLVNFQNRYSRMTYKYFEPIFDIGFNYGFRSDSIYFKFENSDKMGFGAEKIGFKIKPWNFKYKRAKSNTSDLYREDRSVISSSINDIHFLAFVSGLLYEMTPIKPNTKNSYPESTYLGLGMGISFANDFNFNMSYGFLGGRRPGFVAIGLDISVAEYSKAILGKVMGK